MNNHLNEVFGDRYVIKKATLYYLIGSLNEVRHVLKTENGWQESYTQQNTYEDSTSTDREKVQAGMRWARTQVGNDVEVSYSNSVGIELREAKTKPVPLELNEAWQAHEGSSEFNKLLLLG